MTERPPPPDLAPPDPRTQRDEAPARPPPPDALPPGVFSARLPTMPMKAVTPEDPKVSRRRFVRLGLGGAALLGVGGVLAWQTSGYEVSAETAARLYALSPKEYLIVSALAARMLRRDAEDLPTPEELEAALAIDVLVARLDADNRRDLLRLLHALEHVLPLSVGVASRFTRASGPEQDLVLQAMSEHSVGLLRGAFSALKSLCVMAYFSSPLTWGAIGYDGPLVSRPAEGWVEAARLGRGASG